MTVYSFENVVGQTIAFNALNDIFSVSGTAANALSFSESNGAVTIRKSNGDAVTLSGTTLAQLSSGNNGTGANLVLGGSNGFALFGDDKTTSSADSSGNSPTIAGLVGPLTIFGLGGGDTLNASTITADVNIYGGTSAGDSTDGGDTISIGTGNATVSGNGGNDAITFITNSTNQANIYGGAGNDTINSGATAGSGKTLIYGNLGSDVINLSAGAGNTGDATIFGGNGQGDTGDGADTITTGTGNTQITAGGGNDAIVLNITANSATVAAGVGNDTITDNAILTGEETFSLGTGNDSIVLDILGAGSDVTIYGAYAGGDTADGADVITLTSGAGTGVTVTAKIEGHGGNDTITVDDANDTIQSTILGGQGNDSITGDATTGTSNIDGGAGNDTITGGDGTDTLVGGAGADSITGGAGNDSIDGGDDGDVLITTSGNDTVLGGGGGDTITGNAGTDSIDGGDGNDSIDGAAANDTITGGAGDDTIDAGVGADSITSGDGADVILFKSVTGTDTITGTIADHVADTFIFDISDLTLGASTYSYAEQVGGDLTANGTTVVLTTAYASTAAAGTYIAADADITAANGIFIYFNSSDNTAHVVKTADLGGDGADVELAVLTGVSSATQLADFSIADFNFQA
ncbi:MAG: calcium-binding protein [Rickettsiales bacterium]